MRHETDGWIETKALARARASGGMWDVGYGIGDMGCGDVGCGIWDVGMWECGNVGMWECGNVGMWECGVWDVGCGMWDMGYLPKAIRYIPGGVT